MSWPWVLAGLLYLAGSIVTGLKLSNNMVLEEDPVEYLALGILGTFWPLTWVIEWIMKKD